MGNLAEFFGNRIREIRKLKGLKQEDMENFGLSYKYYQKIERGKANLTLATVERISKALEIAPEEIFPFPQGKSREADELVAMLREIIAKNNPATLRKLNLFIKEIL
jgi:transcriptional regulator with XRE-family HTH domain